MIGCGGDTDYLHPDTAHVDKNRSKTNFELDYTGQGEEITPLKQADVLPKDGVITECYEDGAKMSEITYEQGVKNGISKSWFSNGQLKEERGYLNDRFHGAYRVWAKTGLPRISGFYSNGKQHGEWILYDQDGEPMPSVYYEDGVEVTRILPSLRD